MVTFREVAEHLVGRNLNGAELEKKPDLVSRVDVEANEPTARLSQWETEGPHERWYVSSGADQRDRFQLVDGFPPFRLVRYRDSYEEDVLRLCEDSTGQLVAPKNRYLPNVGIYVSQVRGEKYYEVGCRDGDFSPGVSVSILREPNNPYDTNAVAVLDGSGLHRGGYIDKMKARRLARLLDAGEPLEAISIRGTPAGQECPQIAVLVASPAFMRHLFLMRPPGAPLPVHLRMK